MESELIDWLRRTLPTSEALRVGLEDDAAVVRWASSEVVATTDMLMDGVDFVLGEVEPRRVGHKILAVNLSDLAAMAAQPVAACVSLALPRRGGLPLAQELYRGMLPLAERHAVLIAGGDTNSWDGPLVANVTLLGRPLAHGPLRRSQARAGDKIIVTGALGGSILGHHLDFEPRVAEAQLLHERYEVHAGMDISDGLALDLSRLCRASGCGAILRTAAVPISTAALDYARQLDDGSTPLDHALADGEDFELLLAVPPAEAAWLLHDQPLADVRLTEIGEFVAAPGLWQQDQAGLRSPLAPRGFEHRLD
ncbi:MAG: thiamine-monophosphate kinase [Pirellulales bacterium]|nr:thiamine-monophosphate kinase [Pirellulales bacterium]